VERIFEDVLKKPDVLTGLPSHRGCELDIELVPDMKLLFGPIIPLSGSESTCLTQYWADALKLGHIVPFCYPVGSLIFFVRKKEGGLRPVVDYRYLKKVTIKNHYPLSLVDSLWMSYKVISFSWRLTCILLTTWFGFPRDLSI
jgi:hypothetical protein